MGSDANVLITGEHAREGSVARLCTRCARANTRWLRERRRTFEVFESELFGHVKARSPMRVSIA